MIKKKRHPPQEVNSSSMADLSFCVLCFILIVADFVNEPAVAGEIVTDVIEEVEGGLDGNKSEWTIKIAGDGKGGNIYYMFEGEEMALETIKERIMKAAPSISEIGIFGSKDVPHGKVTDFFSFCRTINIPAYEGVFDEK